MARQEVELWLYDDNVDPKSKAILRRSGARVLGKIPKLDRSAYRRAPDTHKWDVPTYRRVAAIKNLGIDSFLRRTRADFLFLIDSDVLLPPGAIDHLVESDLPVVSHVYWTSWYPELGRGPNSWGSPPEPLREPGHHEVVGLGASTLIRREVLRSARFDPVPSLEREGEDRWFCYRAREAGYPLTMCSHLELFHVYRDSEIPGAIEYSDRVLST